MSSDGTDDRPGRERDARRAALFALLITATTQLTTATDERGPLLWLGLVFVAVGLYYATKSTFRLKSEDEPDYEKEPAGERGRQKR